MTSFPLVEVASKSMRRGVPTVLVAGAIVSVGDPVHRALPLLGSRFGSSVDAVAARVGFGSPHAPPPVVAVDRWHEAVLLDPVLDDVFDVSAESSVVIDSARRSLGLATAPPERPVDDYVDAEWLHRILAATLAAPLGEPPRWELLAALHPLAAELAAPMSPEHIAHTRGRRGPRWDAVRDAVIQRRCTWPAISASLAAWFDAGSLSRHLLSLLPEAQVVRADLAELLRPDDVARIETATCS